MSQDIEPPPKDEFELKVRQYELERRKFEREDRSIWTRLPVAITAIAGLSAIGFQLAGAAQARFDRDTARAHQAEDAARNDRDFDFKGLELFITRKGDLVSCNPDTTAKNLSAFTLVLSEKVKPALHSLVDAGVSGCAAAAQATAGASASGTAKDQGAYYASITSQAGVLTATSGASATGSQRYRVFLQYEAQGDQLAATTLQLALQRAGYRAPGVQHVSVAPKRYEVRYYKDADKPAAAAVAALMAKTLNLAQSPAIVSLQALYPNLPSGLVEVWFPAGSAAAPPVQAPASAPRASVTESKPASAPVAGSPPAGTTVRTEIRFSAGNYKLENLSDREQKHLQEALASATRSGVKKVLVTGYETSHIQSQKHTEEGAKARADLVADAVRAKLANPEIVSTRSFGRDQIRAQRVRLDSDRIVTVDVSS